MWAFSQCEVEERSLSGGLSVSGIIVQIPGCIIQSAGEVLT